MKAITKTIMVAAPVLLSMSAAQAALINGGFETGNLSGWNSLGTVGASTGVDYGVGVVNPDTGDYAALLNTEGASAADIAAQMGVSESALEATNPGRNATNGSLLWQTTAANVGDSFRFRWNFVEQDYLPFDDWAFYGISVDGGPAILSQFASLGSVGPGDGTTINGWTTLNVDITTSGTYTFYFGVVNAEDTLLDSRLWIDNVQAKVLPPVGQVPDGGSTIALLGLALTVVAGARRKLSI
jgi:VPDSG-CTERM motif